MPQVLADSVKRGKEWAVAEEFDAIAMECYGRGRG